MLELLFLADVTYLNNEVATSLPSIAPWAALAHLVLAGLKLLVFRRILGLTSLRVLTVSLAQIGLVAFAPAFFSNVHFMDSKVHALGLGRELLPLVVYGLWCVVGAVPIAMSWADRDAQHGEKPQRASLSRALIYIPFGSLLLHMLSLHWLYDLPFFPSYVAPLLLSTGFYAVYAREHVRGIQRASYEWGIPVAAIALSSHYPDSLVLTVGQTVLSPVRIGLFAVAVVFALHRIVGGRNNFGWAATAAAVLSVSGPSFRDMWITWRDLAPESPTELGLMALTGAFAFLALGLAVSLGGDGPREAMPEKGTRPVSRTPDP